MSELETPQRPSAALTQLATDYAWPQRQPTAAAKKDHGWLHPSTQDFLKSALSPEVKLVVELGCWLGLSTRFIADCAPQATVVAIDHWRGSPEHHSNPEWASMLDGLYESFLASCWEYRRRLIPLRVTTLDGLCILARRGLEPDVIYVDADHSFEAVEADFEGALALFPDAAIVGDDWACKSVQEAVSTVAQRRRVNIDARENAWRAAGLFAKRNAVDSKDDGLDCSSTPSVLFPKGATEQGEKSSGSRW